MTSQSSESAQEQTTHFGFKEVPVHEKAERVGEVFSSVATNYDIMNDLMSGGMHRLWKRHFVAMANIRPDDRVLDLAGGTGDIAALVHRYLGEQGSVTVADINADMLRVGRDRLTDKGIVRGVDFVQANAESLPFDDDSFDCVTMAFGLRNVTHKNKALKDIHRVLKVGGKAMILEFSEFKVDALKPLYRFHLFQVLPRIGKLVAKDADSYQYLSESIQKHPPQDELKTMMDEAGLSQCRYQNILGGVVAIHRGIKA